MKIENMTIHGGNQQFSNLTGLEQEVIDALREQAEAMAAVYNQSDHSAPVSAQDCLTPKASAMIGKMQELLNTQP